MQVTTSFLPSETHKLSPNNGKISNQMQTQLFLFNNCVCIDEKRHTLNSQMHAYTKCIWHPFNTFM